MPTKVYQILFKRKPNGPIRTRDQTLGISEMINARHHGIIVFDQIVNAQHPQSELICHQLERNGEVVVNQSFSIVHSD